MTHPLPFIKTYRFTVQSRYTA